MSRPEWLPRSLAQSFGVELTLNLAEVNSEVSRDLLIALRRSKLVLVRKQELDEDAYIRLGSMLGQLWTVDGALRGNAESPHAVRSHVEIARVSNKGGMLQDRAVDWHGDLAHHPTDPYPGRILYAKAVPEDAVSVTSWVDLEYGWNCLLSDEERRLLAGQTGQFRAGYETEWGATEHPILRRHPARGSEWASIDRAFLRGFSGMTPERSAELKKWVLGKLIVGAAIYRHVWEPGDVIIYDNEGTMHRRERVYSDAERTIWRLTLQYEWSAVA